MTHIEIDENDKTFKIDGQEISKILTPDYVVDISSDRKRGLVTVTFIVDELTYRPKQVTTVKHVWGRS